MAKIFLDTNIVIDIVLRKPEAGQELDGHDAFLSPLSIHILCYADKRKMPNDEIIAFTNEFHIVNLSENLLQKALFGPTSDLEDNIQLHSAAEAECDYFLTSDEKLLKMKFFGKTQIALRPPNLPQQLY